jgi:hypothetical protein
LRATDEGTKEWKLHLEAVAIRHLRALDQVNQAYQCFARLSQGGNTLDAVVKSALFTSAVIHYSRPFGKNRGSPTSSSKYSIKELQNPNVDRVLHEHLLDLRDKLVAHQDGTVLPARIGHYTIAVHEADLEIPVQTFGAVWALQGVATVEILTRYLQHVEACAEAIQANVNSALTAVNAAEHEYPEVKPDERQKLDVFLQKTIARGEEVMFPDLANSSANIIGFPTFPVPPDSYMWRRTLITLTPEGSYEWVGPEGPASLSVRRRSL